MTLYKVPALKVLYHRVRAGIAFTSSQALSTTSSVRSRTHSVSPHAPIGVGAAVQASSSSSFTPRPKIFEEFSLHGRVGIVTGANRGLGLEMALALCEAGAKAIYCLDVSPEPSEEWKSTCDYVRRMGVGGRLEYAEADVRNQKAMWELATRIGDKEEGLDVCIAAAGILKGHMDCLEYSAQQFKEVLDVNVNGVLHTAQAAGQQMRRFKNGGSIILVASMSGSITNKDHAWTSYNASKAAVLQMTRNMAYDLGPDNIRVNSISPGHIYTKMTAAFLETRPELLDVWSSMNPLHRIGRPDELRGVVTWLASDASSFCTGSDILVTGGYHI